MKPKYVIDCILQNRRLREHLYVLHNVRKDSSSMLKHYRRVESDDGDVENGVTKEKVAGDDTTATTTTITTTTTTNAILSPLATPQLLRLEPVKTIPRNLKTTGNDPNFYREFFSNSRLHHIGGWAMRSNTKSDPNDNIGSDRIRSNKSVKLSSTPPGERVVMHVDIDEFFAAVVLRDKPELKDKPVVVCHGDGGKGSNSEISTCNYPARDLGIRKGMFLARARQVAGDTDIIVMNYDFEGFEDVSSAFFDLLSELRGDNFTVTEIEQMSCDEAYLEVYIDACIDEGAVDPLQLSNSSYEDDYGDEDYNPSLHSANGCNGIRLSPSLKPFLDDLCSQIREDMRSKTKVNVSIGVGKNKFLSKMGTDRIKPDGHHIVYDPTELLGELNLRQLYGVGRKTAKR